MQPKQVKLEEWESSFNILADKWEEDTALFSLMDQIAQHPAYQLILGMGEKGIPLIMRRIEQQGGLWYHALETITGIPSPAGTTQKNADGWYAVDVKKVNASWLKWGREQGYEW